MGHMCDPTVMIDAAIATLTRLSVDEANILYDEFVTKMDTAG
jgi:Na+-transporting NADH:ubiquinone oxidoreductase subunit NqrF